MYIVVARGEKNSPEPGRYRRYDKLAEARVQAAYNSSLVPWSWLIWEATEPTAAPCAWNRIATYTNGRAEQ
jgi:hypothetical protein